MNKIILLVSFAAIVYATIAAKPDCGQLAKKSELCFREAIFMGDTKVPQSVEEWNSYSSVFSKAVKCLKDYKGCNKGILRQVYTLFVSGVIKFGKEAFAKTSDPNKYLNAIQCFDNEMLASMQQCMNAYTSRIEYIKGDIDDKNVFPKLCCTIRMMEQCIRSTVGECKAARKEAVDFTTRLVNSFFGDATELLCAKQSNVSICDANHAEFMASLRNVTVKQLKKNEFILVPSVELIQKLLE